MNTRKSDKPTVGEAEGALARATKFIEVLQETHSSIPQALSQEQQLSGESGSAAITGGDVEPLHARLNAIQERRKADVRRRASAVEGLLELEGELAQARAAADQERSQLATAAVTEFMGRWNHACRALAVLHAEAAALSAALHAPVPTPAPYAVALNVVNDRPELKLAMPLEPQPLALPPALATVAGALDRLDAVLTMVGGIKQAQLLDSRLYMLSLQRGAHADHGGVYRVIAEFVCAIDGLPFRPGELVDGSLIGAGHLQRLTAGKRYIMPVGLETRAA